MKCVGLDILGSRITCYIVCRKVEGLAYVISTKFAYETTLFVFGDSHIMDVVIYHAVFKVVDATRCINCRECDFGVG